MPISTQDPRLQFVIDADNRASAKMDAVTASSDRLGAATNRLTSTYTRLTEQDLAQASQWFDNMYGSTTRTATATAALGEGAEAAARRTSLAAERMSGGLLMVARSGEVSARGIRSLLGGATDLAFAFGPEGAWLTAISIAGLALSEFWDRQQKEADKAAKEYQKVLDVIKKLSIGEQEATAGTAQGQVNAYNRTLASLRAQMAQSRGESAVGFAKEIEGVEKLRDAAQALATAAGNNAERDKRERQYKSQAEDMKQDISDLEGRLSTARKELAEEKKTGVGPEEDPGKLASELAQKRAALVAFYNEEHNFMQVNLDDELQAINTEARRYAQGEDRAAQEQRFASQRQARIDQLKQLKEALKDANTAIEGVVKPIEKGMMKNLNSFFDLPDTKDLAEGARAQIAGESGTSRVDDALLKGYGKQQTAAERKQIQDAAYGGAGGASHDLPPDIKARMEAIAKESKTVEEAEKKKRALMAETYKITIAAEKEFGDVMVSSRNKGVQAVGNAALAIRRFQIGAIAAQASVESARAFAKVPGALAIQDYTGAALWAASGVQLAAAAALGFKESLGGGGSGSASGGGVDGSSTGGANGAPGTFRPTDQGQGNGSFTLNLITQHPASPSVVQSIAYELNRSNVLKRPPIQIPPTAGLQPFNG